ncbi:MAG: hypothetical protein PHO57_03800 [Acidithiobacillus sp.]|nr:hypothetical protein [Acidithiobacillus sp.]
MTEIAHHALHFVAQHPGCRLEQLLRYLVPACPERLGQALVELQQRGVLQIWKLTRCAGRVEQVCFLGTGSPSLQSVH